jgi:hypothetical protein
MMTAARQQQPIEFTFNCDAPNLQRVLRMQIKCLADGALQFRTNTLATRKRDPVPVSCSPNAEGPLVLMCSWCKRVSAPTGWLDTSEAVRVLALFRGSESIRITHGTCEDCYQSLMAAIGGSASPGKS